MRRHLLTLPAFLALAFPTAGPARAALAVSPRPVRERPLLDVKADEKTGKIIATLPRASAGGVSGRYIYISQLETGLGSAPTQLDFGAASSSRILVFRRVGRKVIAEIENSRFVTSNPAEQQTTEHSFPNSPLWMGAVDKDLPDGSYQVDISGFIARDDIGIARVIKSIGGGDFKFVPELSAADPGFVKLFPRNVELAARITFRADEPKEEMTNILPAEDTMSVVERHSFIALPEPGYEPRTDVYGYTIGLQQIDFSKPLGTPIVTNLARRFRLEKVDPAAAHSRVKRPIVFYVDPAMPPAIRNAVKEGVEWWATAFQEAGFDEAFKVEVLPPGADPLDVRFNVVNWVNRATRGWSYGEPIADPRTGEIIKGAVVLGSLRARQDMIIFQSLVGAGLTGTGSPDDPITAALARLRQLGAHEVGHAIGLAHNFAASTQGRYSVMDYPAPRVTVVNGAPSLRDAYAAGLGPWDRWIIKWLYGGNTDAEAAAALAGARAAGLRFVADSDARPISSGHPFGSLWDDGPDALAELRRMIDVRRVAIARFGTGALSAGEQLADLRRAFVPIWLLDRYQIEAAAKSLGGVNFPYATNTEGMSAQAVSGERQWATLDALLDTITPQELTVPAHLLPLLSGGFGGDPDRQAEIEIIPTSGGPVFDPFKASEVGAVQTLNALLAPARLNRLEAQHSVDRTVPSPEQLFDLLLSRTVAQSADDVGRRVATTAILALARTQRDASLSPAVAFQLSGRLARLADDLQRLHGASQDWARGIASLLKDQQALGRTLDDPARVLRVPPGMPIGMDEGL